MARRISCEQISPLLSAYLDGELSKAERECVEWHLRECEACRSELRELEKTKQFALQLGEVQPPLSLRQRIMAKVEQEQECQTIRPLLGAYIDGELSSAQREKVELHIAMCNDCQKELEAERKVRQVLQTIPEVEPPVYLRARIYASIERKPVLLRRFALGFATLAAAASLVFFALPIHRAPTTSTTPVISQRDVPSVPSQAQQLQTKDFKVAVKFPEKTVVTSKEKPTRVVIPKGAAQPGEQAITTTQPTTTAEEENVLYGVNRPVILPQPAEKPSAPEVKEETKIAEQPNTPKEVTPTTSTTTPIKVAVKPEPSLSEVLKDITRSVDKPSLPSKLTERLDKSIVIGVAKVEF